MRQGQRHRDRWIRMGVAAILLGLSQACAGSYAGRFLNVSYDRNVPLGSGLEVQITVRNTGTSAWGLSSYPGWGGGFQWWENSQTRHRMQRWFHEEVAPGETVTGSVTLDPEHMPGTSVGAYSIQCVAYYPSAFASSTYYMMAACPVTISYRIVIPPTTLIAPEGVVSDTRRPEFSWAAVSQANWYHIWVSRNGSAYLEKWTQETTWQPETDLRGGEYTWWVQTYHGGPGAWSAPKTFTIPLALPEKIVLESPADTIDTDNPAFEWQADAHATWYRLMVQRNGAAFYNHWYQGMTSCTPAKTFPMGRYQWWVHGWSPDGRGPWSDPGSFTYGLSEPIAPTGVASNPTPQFTWTEQAAADWYLVHVTRNGAFYRKKWVQNTTALTFPAEFAYGNYRWWVQTWNPNGFGPWSDAAAFCLGKPVAVAGSANQVRWDNEPTSDADWYQVRIDDVSGGGRTAARDWWFERSATADLGCGIRAIAPSPALPAGAYEWSIRAWDRTRGTGPWSAAQAFSVP